MTREDAEEFTQSLGQIIGGSWRQILLSHKIGVPKALGLSTEQWVQQRLGGYVKLSVSDRKEAVVELLNDGLSQREVAEVLGVGVATVNRDTVPNGTATDADIAENVPNGTNISPKQLRTEQEERIKNQREAMIRLGCEAYSSTQAWAAESFLESVNEALSDQRFRSEFLTRLRVDPSNLTDIQEGAKSLTKLLTKLTK